MISWGGGGGGVEEFVKKKLQSPSKKKIAQKSFFEGLTLETSAKHHIPQATNIPYQPLLIKPIFSVLAHAEKQFFSKLVFECCCHSCALVNHY